MGSNWIAGWLAFAGVVGMASAEDTARASIGDSRLSAGDEVILDEYVPGNAFLAGGRVQLNDRVGGTAVVTGGEVEITGSVGRSLFVSGGDVRIEGEVEGKVRAAGGKVRITRDATLRDDVALAGGSVDVEGEIGENLRAYGESIFINGAIGGDLTMAGESIRIGPDAQIEGRVEYKSGSSIDIDPQARLGKGIEEIDEERRWLRKIGRGATIVGGITISLGMVLLGAILILGMPGFSREAAALLRREPLQSGGLGCVMLIGVPFAIIVLLITVIGIPLALMLAFGYVVLLMLGYVISAIFVGDTVLERLSAAKLDSMGWRMLFMFLALVALAIVRQVPMIGGLVIFLLFVAGIGAFTMRSWRAIRQRDAGEPATT
jgi:cytoskeletal protein CcmA (bactofilin family)